MVAVLCVPQVSRDSVDVKPWRQLHVDLVRELSRLNRAICRLGWPITLQALVSKRRTASVGLLSLARRSACPGRMGRTGCEGFKRGRIDDEVGNSFACCGMSDIGYGLQTKAGGHRVARFECHPDFPDRGPAA